MEVHRATALRWLRPPLQAALVSARELLFAVPPGRRELEQACAVMQELRGALTVAEQHLAALLAEEGAALLRWVLAGEGDAGDEVRYLLLRLTSTLEWQLEAPAAHGAGPLVPLLDDLRTARGARLYCESHLYPADHAASKAEMKAAAETPGPPPSEGMLSQVRRLRSHYQRGLAQWLRRPETGEGLELMATATGRLEAVCGDYPLAALFRYATALAEALRCRDVGVSISVRSLLTQVDQVIRGLAELGPDALAEPAPESLTKGLRYYLSRAAPAGDGAAAEGSGPGAGGIDVGAARQALARGGDIISDLLVEEAADRAVVDELAAILASTADLLALHGIAHPRRSLLDCLAELGAVSTERRVPSQQQSPMIAASLMEADQALEELAQGGGREAMAAPPANTSGPNAGELRSTAEALLAARSALVPFLADAVPVQETAMVTARLRRIRERLLEHGLASGADVIDDCAAYLETAAGGAEWVADPAQRAACADALVALGYYLDALTDGVAAADGVIQDLEGRLALLEMPPLETEAWAPGSTPVETGDEAARGTPSTEDVLPARPDEGLLAPGALAAEGLPERVSYSIQHARALLQSIEGPWAVLSAPPADQADAAPPANVLCVDPEFVDVFVHEATAIVADIGEQLPHWQEQPTSNTVAEAVRSGFQALKASARVAGAAEIAELASALERGAAGGSAAVMLPVVADAQERLSATLHALERDEPVEANLDDLVARATATQPLSLPAPLERTEDGAPSEHSLRVGQALDPEPGSAWATGVVDEEAELRPVFLDEAEEILQAARALQADWQRVPDAHRVVRDLHRHLHTLKGGARMAGLNSVSDLCHSEESLLAAVLAGSARPTEALQALVERCHERLSRMVEAARSGLLPGPADDLDDEISQRLIGGESHVANGRRAADSESAKVPGSGANHSAVARVQVSADKLHELSQIAGEITVSGGRVERKVGAVRGSLEEMDAILHRLRRQLLRLDSQARSHGHSDVDEEIVPGDRAATSELQQTARKVAESLADLEHLRDALDDLTADSQTVLRAQARANAVLQRSLISSRLVSLAPHVPRLRRLVSRTAEDLAKQVELVVEGDDLMLEAPVLSRLIAPLEHMLRNAVDHGVESPEDRARLGKPAAAQLRLTVSRSGPDVLIRLNDDGRGLDLEAIRREAEDRGLITSDASVADDELLSCIFEQEFTTAAEITQISGRGVGLDVVHDVVSQLGGTLSLDTTAGQGTEFSIRLPAVPSTSQLLLIRAGDGRYALPLTWVDSVVRLDEREWDGARSRQPPSLQHGGHTYALAHLASLLGEERRVLRRRQGRYTVVLVRAEDHRAALLVDAVTTRRELVVEPVSPPASRVGWLAGAAVAEDGGLVLVVDLLELCARAVTEALPAELETSESAPVAASPQVLVIDDSITLRKLTESLLVSHGMRVVLVRDRSEALASLQDQLPDVVMIHGDMPGTDGYALAEELRGDARYSALPLIMLTSDNSRQRPEQAAAQAAQVDLAKPYREEALVDAVRAALASG